MKKVAGSSTTRCRRAGSEWCITRPSSLKSRSISSASRSPIPRRATISTTAASVVALPRPPERSSSSTCSHVYGTRRCTYASSLTAVVSAARRWPTEGSEPGVAVLSTGKKWSSPVPVGRAALAKDRTAPQATCPAKVRRRSSLMAWWSCGRCTLSLCVPTSAIGGSEASRRLRAWTTMDPSQKRRKPRASSRAGPSAASHSMLKITTYAAKRVRYRWCSA
mmetsp:Transcript_33076/g.69160  ORF Transcript_33076/g.69160 Transcript_33076/m.69160 type:complete len:221 (+) Transcript_33076:1667-2329(+)